MEGLGQIIQRQFVVTDLVLEPDLQGRPDVQRLAALVLGLFDFHETDNDLHRRECTECQKQNKLYQYETLHPNSPSDPHRLH